MKLSEMSKDERSLLLFLETRAVDFGGRVDTRHMNDIDMAIANRWNKESFVSFGRIVIRHHNSQGTHWCKLSEEAWELAHAERRQRELRLWHKRSWITTAENREVNGDPHTSGMNADQQPAPEALDDEKATRQ